LRSNNTNNIKTELPDVTDRVERDDISPVESTVDQIEHIERGPAREFSIGVFKPEQWSQIASDIIAIEEACFSGKLGKTEREHTEMRLESAFKNPDNMIVVATNDEGRVAGYAYTHCCYDGPAHIKVVAVHPDFQGKRLVASIMDVVEDRLRDLGYEEAKIEPVKENGYADKVTRSYGRRITDYFEDQTHAHVTFQL
jgi:ribosomal protein S18 acetylase RimI-like enzyme